jgi:Putative capsular polysaccharide synthesis protein
MYDLKSYQMLSDKDIILVYQMGKVGSNSIRWSLEKLGIGAPHIHSLYKNRGYELYKNFLLSKMYYPLHKKVLCSLFYAWQRFKLRRRKHLKVITLVREPISVNISSFFHNLSYFSYEIEQKNANSIEEAFVEKFNHDYALNWFDDDFLPTIGLDIYKHNFDKQAGYAVIKEKNVDCLIIKLEKLNGLEKVIADFVGNEEFKLINHNISSEKWFNPIYKEFKANIKFDADYVDKIYSSKFMQHFYSSEEISEFKNKFLKPE